MKITQCRICGNKELETIFDLGNIAHCGIFPKELRTQVPKGNLCLVRCVSSNQDTCGLVQLSDNSDLDLMFRESYGYRSSLNSSMVTHLCSKASAIIERAKLSSGELVIDIGSNDGTLLNYLNNGGYKLLGIDPTISLFEDNYEKGIMTIDDFFSYKSVREVIGDSSAKIIFSFSMLYDLPDPMTFVKDVQRILHPEGLWYCEQSYLISMLETNSFDTICHEHLEYYSVGQLKWIFDKCDLMIVDVEFNSINGGSFGLTLAHKNSNYQEYHELNSLLKKELNYFEQDRYLQKFKENVNKTGSELINLLRELKSKGKKVAGLGASTKGNVLLQYYNLDDKLIPVIGEVNEDKIGKYTPGSNIPIVSEDLLLSDGYTHLLVLPWHFRQFFTSSNKFSGKKLIFPLPKLEIFDG